MKIIEPSARLISPICVEEGLCTLQFIERMARISHKSEETQTETSWQRFLDLVITKKGDWSVTEHGHASVIFRVDRGVAIELRTHRYLFADMESAYTQESTRFVRGDTKYPDGLEFIQPAELKNPEMFTVACVYAEYNYLSMLDNKERPQEARSVLPNAYAATIGITCNLRAWRNFLLMRTTQETHADFRRVTIPLLADFKARMPLLFDDIEPNARQIDNLRKPR